MGIYSFIYVWVNVVFVTLRHFDGDDVLVLVLLITLV